MSPRYDRMAPKVVTSASRTDDARADDIYAVSAYILAHWQKTR
jgi:hypothetical protein